MGAATPPPIHRQLNQNLVSVRVGHSLLHSAGQVIPTTTRHLGLQRMVGVRRGRRLVMVSTLFGPGTAPGATPMRSRLSGGAPGGRPSESRCNAYRPPEEE